MERWSYKFVRDMTATSSCAGYLLQMGVVMFTCICQGSCLLSCHSRVYHIFWNSCTVSGLHLQNGTTTTLTCRCDRFGVTSKTNMCSWSGRICGTSREREELHSGWDNYLPRPLDLGGGMAGCYRMQLGGGWQLLPQDPYADKASSCIYPPHMEKSMTCGNNRESRIYTTKTHLTLIFLSNLTLHGKPEMIPRLVRSLCL